VEPSPGEFTVGPVAIVRFVVGTVSVAALTGAATLALWAVAYPTARGWSPMAVTSGSMSPSIRVGDVLVAAPATDDRLVPGAVIVFENPAGDGFITHRVVERRESGEMTTQGDANPSPDSTPVRPDQVRGVGRLVVPLIGRPQSWAANGQWGRVGIVVLLFGLALWFSRWGSVDDLSRPSEEVDRSGRTQMRPRGTRGVPVLGVVLICFGVMFSTATRAVIVDPADSGTNSITAASVFP
jgi:signal peptidase I